MKGKMVYITISLFLGLIFAPAVHASGYEKLSTPIVLRNYAGDILYVGGNGPQNYSTIQNAVNSAHPGDTIFVYSYSSPYHENIIIETNEIQLIGENKYATIIDGNSISDVIQIKSDYVTISGFTIQHSGLIEHTEYHAGVHMIYPSNYNNITNNIIINNNNGICIQASNNNTVSKNMVSHNLKGILFLAASIYNIISENNFENNNISFFFGASVYNSIIENNIKNSSEYGLVLYFSRFQTTRKNNFINNTRHVYFIERFRLAFDKNDWMRNYWDNWIGIGPKILKGEMFTEWIGQKLIPWINFDWIPAYRPYNIQV